MLQGLNAFPSSEASLHPVIQFEEERLAVLDHAGEVNVFVCVCMCVYHPVIQLEEERLVVLDMLRRSMYECMDVCVYVCVCVCVCVHTYMHACTCIHTCVCTYIHTYTHTHTHTRTHQAIVVVHRKSNITVPAEPKP
jgi:hypothetical protein